MASNSKEETGKTLATKRVTLQDIAEVAGVRKMVVSNVLNNTGRVAPATREKVREIAREMNYIPNFAARALTTGRTGIVAIISGPLNQPYYANMIDLLEEHLTAAGLHLLLMRTPKEVRELVSATGNVAVDGAIAVDMQRLVDEFRAHPTIPCVSISTSTHSFADSVVIDLSEGVRDAVRIMLAAGCQRISYLVTALNMGLETEVRAGAYLSSMRRANLPAEIIDAWSDSAHAVERKFKVYVQQHGCPDGLLCQNDETAMSAFRVLSDLGYDVPNDVLLVGCDGQHHMRYFNPPLSTINQPMEEACSTAWEFLKNRLEQPALPRQEAVLSGKLVVRKSLFSPKSVQRLA